MGPADLAVPQNRLLEWFDRHGRRGLPWRHTRDPWAVLVSEVMLQQTGADRIARRWADFVERWPTPEACAAADLSELLDAWAGLGYPRRVRNLREAARVIVADHGGRMPAELDALLALPGIGPYTARAVLAFAFEHDVAVLDTNVGRILARLEGRRLTTKEAQAAADNLVPEGEGWAWNQAMLDLGAIVCGKRSAKCDACPVSEWCAWRGRGADPAEASAAVSTRQAPYEGSDRQLRGEVLRVVTSSPTAAADVATRLSIRWAKERVERVLDDLIAEGFVERIGQSVKISG